MPSEDKIILARSAPPRGAPGGVPLPRVCGHLIRRSQQVHNLLWVEEVANDLTSAQHDVLAVLAIRPGTDQAQLGELVSLDKSSVADVVARLTGRKWVSRERDPGDARRNVLALTAPADGRGKLLALSEEAAEGNEAGAEEAACSST